MRGLTQQELAVIEKSITLTWQQGQPSLNDAIRLSHVALPCAYRGENNLKCAVGHLITDEWYTSDLENHAVHELIVVEALEESLGFEVLPELVEALYCVQRAHDDASKSDSPFLGSFKYYLIDYLADSPDSAIPELVDKLIAELEAQSC